jgi:hypothetical protein
MAKKETTKKITKKVEKKTKVNTKPEITQEELEEPVVPVVTNLDGTTEPAEPLRAKQEPEVEVMNGDPSVVAPVEEAAPIEEEPVTDDLTPGEPLEEIDNKTQEEKKEPQVGTKPKKNVIKRLFGYIWNGQEMDY